MYFYVFFSCFMFRCYFCCICSACESCLKQYTRIKSNNNKQLATTGEALTQPKQQDKEIENYKTTTATAKK